MIIEQVLARACVSRLFRPDSNGLGYIQICAFLMILYPALISFFLLLSMWILWADQGSIKLYRRKLSCIDTNPLSTLLALICITFFFSLQKRKSAQLIPANPHAIFMNAYGKLDQHMRCLVDGHIIYHWHFNLDGQTLQVTTEPNLCGVSVSLQQ
jgi:hypothetical protein